MKNSETDGRVWGKRHRGIGTVRKVCQSLVEQLETRQMMSLLGVVPGLPRLSYVTNTSLDATPQLSYNSGTFAFDANGTPFSMTFPSNPATPVPVFNPSSGLRDIHFNIDVNNSGGLVGGVSGDDLVITGTVTDPVSGTPYTGTLLSGEIEEFGFQAGSGSVSNFDFVFRASNGSLMPFYRSSDIGVTLTSINSTFTGDFSKPFTGQVNGFVGPVPPVPNNPSVVTAASFKPGSGNAVGSAIPEDSAIISGGYKESGPITFTLTAPDGTTADTEIITPSGDGTYTTSNANVATQVGTYTWHVSYAGDAFNTPANDQGGAAEQVTVVPASPAISTLASETTNVVGMALLSDSVTVSGGDNPTGIVTFTLTRPDGSTIPAGSATINGDATYAGPTGILATQVGTYTFHATYAGDSLNNGAIDSGANESVTTVKATPAISTSASETTNVVGTALLSDSVTVTGGDNPTGLVTFTVTQPDGTTVPAGSVTINGDGTYPLLPPVLATQVGTYTFHASYAGDSLNNGAVDNGANESAGTAPAQPQIVTSASSSSGNVVGSAQLSDIATISGGFNETGTISFSLTRPDGTTIPAGSVSVSGDGNYNSPSLLATEVGTYTWHANYSGDTLNNGAVDNGANESFTTVKASPAISTSASETTNVVGTALLSDSVTVTGGDNPTGLVTFTVTQPDGTTVPAGSVTINGDGSYPLLPPILATQVGTYTFHATYAGDSLNNGAIDNGTNESVSTIKASPSITTQASESGNAVGTAATSDSVTVTGGDAPTGTVTFTLQAPDGTTASTQTVTITGDGVYSVPTPVVATQVGTYTWSASYAGDTLNNGAVDQGGSAEQVAFVSPTGYSIAGTVYCDNNVNATFDTGDELLAGAVVTITDSGGNSVKNIFGVTVGPQTTGANGSYSFGNLPAGNYIVTVTTPAPGHIAEQASGGTVTLNTKTVTVGPSNASNQSFPEIQLGAIEGFVWDDTNCDGNIDWNEVGIQGVTITLSGVNYLGKSVTVTKTTDDSGEYIFAGLLPGTYSLKETQPAGFNQCSNSCGTFNGNQCGTPSCNDTITGINVAGCDNTGINFNFGDKSCTTEGHGAAATIGFWHNKNGQALLLSLNGGPNATGLGNWLATMFPNMYGANAQYDFAGWTNKQIASFYITNDFNVTGVKLNAQVLSVAFASYVTSSNLAGTGAASYGFKVTTTGTGYDLINVGSNGAAFGVANNTSISILQALEATNADASNGVLYATSETVLGVTYSSSTLQSMANTLYSAINQNGDIT